MNRERLLLRARSALNQWFVLAVIVLLAASMFGGWMAYSAYATDDEVEQQTIEAWSTTAGYEHSATVQAENSVFDTGEVVTDQPVYYTRITPELEGQFDFQYDASDGNVDVHIDHQRVIRSVDNDGTEYWNVTEQLGEETAESLEPNEQHTTTFTLDVPGVVNETEEISSSLGDTSGSIETIVVTHVSMEGTIDGEDVSHEDRYVLSLEPDQGSYVVDAPTDERWAEERTEERETETAAGLSDALGGLVLVVVSLSALGAMTVAKVRGTLDPTRSRKEQIRFDHERDRFDDWITRGILPDEVLDKPRVEVDTLEGLVDVAIDCERRVIEERTGNGPSYWVHDDSLLYVYEPVEPATGMEHGNAAGDDIAEEEVTTPPSVGADKSEPASNGDD